MPARLLPSRRFAAAFPGGLLIIVAAACLGHAASAEELPKTLLTERGKIVLSQDFDTPVPMTKNVAEHEQKRIWRQAFGNWEFTGGGLRASQIGEQKHSAVILYPMAGRDGVFQVDVRLDGARRFVMGFNDPVAQRAPTARFPKGRAAAEHVCSVSVDAHGFYAQKDDHDHDGPDVALPFGEVALEVRPGAWKTLLVEIKGDEMVATMDGRSISGAHPLIAGEKATFFFAVVGDTASVRRLRVWEALPNADWPATKRSLPAVNVPVLAPARLPRENLLLFRDDMKLLRPVKTEADWLLRRSEIVQAMQSVMGPLPGKDKRCALMVKTEEEADCGSYVRRLITYDAEPGGPVPAYLCIPKAALTSGEKFPAVLCLHPTDTTTGHGVVVGLGGKANRQYASELAERGYVTIAPSYPQLAKYQPDLTVLGYASGTMKAIWDNIRALDVLDSLPFVKRGRYGVIGHSLGGHNSVYTAVFDKRIAAIVSSCGLDSFSDYYGGKPELWEHGKGWCQDRYMPRLADYRDRLAEIPFDFHELIAALAPRPVFINAPLKDANFQWQSVDRVVAAAREIYRLLGKPDAVRVEHPDCPHDFPDEMRAIAYQLFDSALK